MLNHIWLSLIAVAIAVAVGKDTADEIQNTYRNNVPLEIIFKSSAAPSGSITKWEGEWFLTAQQYNDFYGVTSQIEEIHQPVLLSIAENGSGTFYFSVSETTPSVWKAMAKSSTAKDKLTGTIQSLKISDGANWAKAKIVFEPIRFVKLKAITQAAIDFASTAVEIAIGLIGVMALWLGLVKIAEEAGLVRVLTRLLAPLTKRLFPDVPSDHPAIGAIIMNMAANMLGLNNAATPFGLKAMEELNKLSPKAGTATNAMVTFLAINTGGLVLIPATAIAVRAASGSANPGIIIGTSIFGAACATMIGVAASRLLQKLPRYKITVETEANETLPPVLSKKKKGTHHD
ncbi:MAG TPA: nucleoside recognition domain-containing protein [Bacteroidota bacterium]|nr:nucleoside recognition domain-containing protein [Bacteroidota bacterium]